MEKKVSVIIPVLNREHLIGRCLDSIKAQTWPNIEIVVVDNGSTDSTVDVVKGWMERNISEGVNESISDGVSEKISHTLILLSEQKRGASIARNRGLHNAKGDYIIFMDSDDTLHPDAIEKAMTVFRNDNTIDLVGWRCRINMIDDNTKIPAFEMARPYESHIIHSFIHPGGYMAKRSLLLAAGGWDESLSGWDDWEFGIRILLQSPRIIGLEEILAEIYLQEQSITGTDFSHKEGAWEKAIDKAVTAVTISDHKQKNNLIDMLHYRKALLAAYYYREGNINGAKKLLKEALKKRNAKQQLLLKYAYHHTRFGLRGAWRLIRPFY